MMQFWTLIVCLISQSLYAATYYVDYASGNDASAGTATGTAWKHCPGDSAATGTAAAATLAAGDTVNLRGGVTYITPVSGIVLSWSGTLASPIIYDGTNWNGSGPAVITNTNDTSGGYGFGIVDNGIARSNIIIRGINWTNIGGYSDAEWAALPTNGITSPDSGVAIVLDSGSQDVQILGCGFGKIGSWFNSIPADGVNGVAGVCVYLVNGRRIQVRDCDFTRSRTGISIKGNISFVTVSNCNLHNYLTWPIDIAPVSSGDALTNILITSTRIHDYQEHDSDYWTGYGEAPHTDGIFIRTSAITSTWTNVLIEKCLFYSDSDTAGGTASIFISQGASATIRNCLFLSDDHADAQIYVAFQKSGTSYQRVDVLNNTMVGIGTLLHMAYGTGNGSTDADVVNVLNNAGYRTTVAFNEICFLYQTNTSGNVLWNFNRWFSDYSPAASHHTVYAVNGGFTTLADFKVNVPGQEIESTIGSLGLTSLSGASSTWNAMPTINSALIGAGTNLAAGFGFSTDYAGNPRSSSGAWTIGAYEYYTTARTTSGGFVSRGGKVSR